MKGVVSLYNKYYKYIKNILYHICPRTTGGSCDLKRRPLACSPVIIPLIGLKESNCSWYFARSLGWIIQGSMPIIKVSQLYLEKNIYYCHWPLFYTNKFSAPLYRKSNISTKRSVIFEKWLVYYCHHWKTKFREKYDSDISMILKLRTRSLSICHNFTPVVKQAGCIWKKNSVISKEILREFVRDVTFFQG